VLADLLTDILRDTLIAGGTSIRNRTILFVFSLVTLIGSLCLLFYFRSLPPTTVESYSVAEISYSRVYYDGQTDYPKIFVVADGKDYKIYDTIWRKHYSPEMIVDGLSKSNRAKIWLDSPDSRSIKGIVTPTFSIDPSLGVAWDNENNGAGQFVAWIFIVLGGFLIVTLLFSSYL
jgi:hypothetical protein